MILWRASGCHHERRPGDARDVSWDELCHLGMAGTGDRKDHPKGGEKANRRQDLIGGNENHTGPVSVVVPPENCRGEM